MARHNAGLPEPRRGRGRAHGGGKGGAPGESKPVRAEQRSHGTDDTMAHRKLCGGMGEGDESCLGARPRRLWHRRQGVGVAVERSGRRERGGTIREVSGVIKHVDSG
jgi:hypothetical protein